MAQYRQIHIKIWSSPDFQALSSDGKFVFIYLFSNSHRNEAALYRITPKTISNETDLSADQVNTALSELANRTLIKWDQDSNIIWVVNAIKYQKLSPNEVTGIKNALATIDHEYVEELLTYYEKLFSNYPVSHKEINSSLEVPPGKGKGKGKDKDKDKDKFTPDSVEIELSQYLLDKIRKNNPTHKQPNIQTWAKHMDLLLRVDNKSPEEIRAVIDFAQSDSFWIPNVLSTEKLRGKYDQLNIKRMNSGSRASPAQRETEEERMSRIRAELEAEEHGQTASG